mgnify:CR=1 FL=1
MSAFGVLSALFHAAGAACADTAEIDWFDARLPQAAGPVLELMCGTGRVLVPLVKRGLHVHGVDRSAAMIAACESRLAEEQCSTPLFRQPLGSLNLPFRYAAAYCAGGSFQHLPDPLSAVEALRRVRAHLIPPALLLLDLTVPIAAAHPPGAPLVEVRSVTLADGTRIAARSELVIEPDSRRLEVRTRFERRVGTRVTQREDQLVTRTWYSEEEAIEMVSGAGFIDSRIGEPARTPAGDRGFTLTARASG